MNNFCRGSKYTETKINLKRLHRCWLEEDSSGKNEKWKLAAEQTCRSRAQKLCFINWKATWSEWRNSNRANNPLENFSSEAICTFMNWRLFLANFSVVFWTKYAWRWTSMSRENGIFGPQDSWQFQDSLLSSHSRRDKFVSRATEFLKRLNFVQAGKNKTSRRDYFISLARSPWRQRFPAGVRAGILSWRDPGGKIPGLAKSRRDLGVIGIHGGIPVKTKIPGESPGGIYGGIFFLTESRRENTRVGKIPAGSRGNRDSWRDPGEGEDSRWESRRDLWRDFFPDGILAGKYPGWQDPRGISAGIGILGGIPPRSRWLFYKGTNGEAFTGLARASICMEFPCKDKSFAEKSR